MAIENISDTALWVAYFRALESERPDALFKDPYAGRLAGTVGERLARQLGQAELIERVLAVRTAVFDELILECVTSRAVDLIVNIGAGLDTRPWRLPLPSTAQWVDVDLPAILERKAEVLHAAPPRCEYRTVPADLADQATSDAILVRLDSEGRRALVVTEGLLVYLKPSRVSALARALHRNESVRWWLTDLTGPKALEVLAAAWQPAFAADQIKFQFAPAQSTGFFAPFGWQEEIFRSAREEGQRLRRLPRLPWLSRALLWLSSASQRELFRRMAGTTLMRRS